jgi:hypothetical protein
MVKLIKKIAGDFFDFTKKSKTEANSESEPVFKTRTQLIQEGKGAYLPKRHIHGVPHLIKKD